MEPYIYSTIGFYGIVTGQVCCIHANLFTYHVQQFKFLSQHPSCPKGSRSLSLPDLSALTPATFTPLEILLVLISVGPHYLHVPNVMEIWEPKSPGTLWATPSVLRDPFTFTFFCWRLSKPQGHRIMSMKNSEETIGNRTRDLPACSAVPQPTAPPCTPFFVCNGPYKKDNAFSER